MQTKVFTTAEVAQLSGFSVRQLDYWARQGIIVPSVQQSHGPGTRRVYSLEDLVQIRFVRKLRQNNWSIQSIRRAIEKLREVMNSSDPLKRAVVIHDKRTILAICRTQNGERILVDALDSNGQQVMWIVLEMLENEVRESTKEMVADV